MKEIKVRFAPSPTGFLHIGGARTALFNYLFARHHQGKYFLRIEDTDKTRSTAELTDSILRSLKWLGIQWDKNPYYQSKHIERHKEVCQNLLKTRKAYYCFCDPEELKQKRKKALEKTGEYKYDRKCLNLSKSEIEDKINNNWPKAVRFFIPEGKTEFIDAVRGKVTVNNLEIDDFIILRLDNTPVYQTAVVVDDHDMGITHVIRGDDHISNTPKQIRLYKAMGWDPPIFAHIPMILGSDGKRLSKRHGAVAVESYKKKGILPEALVNFLALQGWAPGDNIEFLSSEEMINKFDLTGVARNAAVFDEKKLIWMNAHYIARINSKRLFKVIAEELIEKFELSDNFIEQNYTYILKCLELMKPRLKVVSDFMENGYYFFKDPEEYEEKPVNKHFKKEGAADRLQILFERFDKIENWEEKELEDMIRGLADELDIGAGKIIHPLRLSLTGSSASPGIFELVKILGKDTVKRRLKNAVFFIETL